MSVEVLGGHFTVDSPQGGSTVIETRLPAPPLSQDF
jgi:hypothetical protein